MRLRWIVFAILLWSFSAEAQEKPRPELRVTGGWVGFIDEDWIDHGAVGGSVRYYLTQRLAVEPELLYMVGPGSDRDITLIPHISFDFRPGRAVRPYVIGGVGFHQFRDKFNGFEFRDNQWTANGGFGVRIPIVPNVFVAPEFRLGFETLLRAAASIGFTF
ncbi:MAG TPA: outer membrane beta-barrel protein [Terriglobia bacterium]|nr:outer membrane beta-barrel protein [Terriglobia bacterium]